jgi:dimethylargininase
LGVELIRLEPDDEHPDACFVEDTVVVHGDRAIVGRMAKESRRGENSSIEEVLSEYKQVSKVSEPGTLEGGDVVHLIDSLLCGITKRTNHDGASQMEHWLKAPVHRIEDPGIMHLKSHVTFLGRHTILVNPRYDDHPVLEPFNRIVLPEGETNSANTLAVGDVVIMSVRHKQSSALVEAEGFEVIQLDMSEFEKCDGALTCLSIFF